MYMLDLKTQRALWAQFLLKLVRQIVLLNLILIGVGFLWRALFLFLYGDTAELFLLKKDLFQAFVLGARFDLTVLCYINSVPLLVFWVFSAVFFLPTWLPLGDKIIRKMGIALAIYYSLFLFVVNFINIVDINFFGFYQDRINLLIFGFISDDTTALVRTIWKNYPVVWVFGALILLSLLLFWFVKRCFQIPVPSPADSAKKPKLSWPTAVILFFALFLVNGVGARGGFGLFPLSEMDTGISKHPFINHLCFNSVRAFTRALELKSKLQAHWDSNLEYYGYASDGRQAFADFFHIPLSEVPTDPTKLMEHKTPKSAWAEKNRPHVLLLVMESFGSYWLQYNSPTFNLLGDLEQHFKDDQVLKNFESSTGATIGSLGSLMIGSPQRPIADFLTESEYLQVPFRTSPARIFKAAGYRARLLYGGNPGWRELNKFARFQGFDTTEGEGEIADGLGGLKEKHDWGIYDEDVWNYLWKTLQQADTPQFVMAMTTTNHPPYQLPSTYKSPELKIPPSLRTRLIGDPGLAPKRFATYRYSTQKLAEFLNKIKNSPLKDKVIVAVTGDHTFWIVNFKEDEMMQKAAVPLYIYMPQALRAEKRNQWNPQTFGSHPDILPTLYNLALSDQTYYTLAADLFAPGPHYAFDASSVILGPAGGALVRKQASYYDWQGNFEKLIPGTETPDKQAMALHYKSLMGALDFYMMSEKKESLSHADSSR